MATITINEALVWQKTLKERHAELIAMRDANSATRTRFYGHTDKEVVTVPAYDVKALDKVIAGLAREMRLLEQQIKATNAVTAVVNYDQNDAVLGEVI